MNKRIARLCLRISSWLIILIGFFNEQAANAVERMEKEVQQDDSV